jgi:hypothetical protein
VIGIKFNQHSLFVLDIKMTFARYVSIICSFHVLDEE